jgi:heme peroxidase
VSHGASVPRGRFGRLFGSLPSQDPDGAAIRDLLPLVDALGSESRSIPAGFTYLAQFVDHDITFDPVSQLDGFSDPCTLENFRTPRLDLDSVYGAGPQDQPYLYEPDGVRLVVGGDEVADLPRLRGRAVIGDPRNDEHLIIAQLHLLFIHFHNAVAAGLPGDLTGQERLRAAQRRVRRHYQWIVLHELLDHVLGSDLARAVRGERRFYDWAAHPFIPVEFSAGAYRFAHSMIRGSYSVNDEQRDKPILAEPDTLGETEHLTGRRPLPGELAIDWRLFFAFGPPALDRPQMSRSIDRHFNGLFRQLPATVSPGGPSLIELDLRRGRALGLPSGHAVARAMGVPALSAADCPLPASLEEAPLWYYVLCEAEMLHEGQHLGPGRRENRGRGARRARRR